MTDETIDAAAYMLDTAQELVAYGYEFMIVALRNFTPEDVAEAEKDDEYPYEPLHIVGYPAEPTLGDIKSLVSELGIDPEFGCNHLTYGEDYHLSVYKVSEVIDIFTRKPEA